MSPAADPPLSSATMGVVRWHALGTAGINPALGSTWHLLCGLGFYGADGEDTVERPGHAPALDLFHVPVVGEAGPAQDDLDGRHPDMARLHGLDAAEREHVGKVDEPELELVDLEPCMRVLAAHVVHRLAERFDDAGQLALTARHQSSGSAHAVPAFGQPRSEEHTSELQSQPNLVCRLLLE